MIPPKVEFHNLTRHSLEFSVVVVGSTVADQIVVTVREINRDESSGQTSGEVVFEEKP